MKGKVLFMAMLLSVLLAGRAEAQRCLPKMRGIEVKAGMTGSDGYWLGAMLSSYARAATSGCTERNTFRRTIRTGA